MLWTSYTDVQKVKYGKFLQNLTRFSITIHPSNGSTLQCLNKIEQIILLQSLHHKSF
jgi:hypothetical protein